MSRWRRDRKAFTRDRIIWRWHPRYDGVGFVEALQDMRERRGEYV